MTVKDIELRLGLSDTASTHTQAGAQGVATTAQAAARRGAGREARRENGQNARRAVEPDVGRGARRDVGRDSGRDTRRSPARALRSSRIGLYASITVGMAFYWQLLRNANIDGMLSPFSSLFRWPQQTAVLAYYGVALVAGIAAIVFRQLRGPLRSPSRHAWLEPALGVLASVLPLVGCAMGAGGSGASPTDAGTDLDASLAASTDPTLGIGLLAAALLGVGLVALSVGWARACARLTEQSRQATIYCACASALCSFAVSFGLYTLAPLPEISRAISPAIAGILLFCADRIERTTASAAEEGRARRPGGQATNRAAGRASGRASSGRMSQATLPIAEKFFSPTLRIMALLVAMLVMVVCLKGAYDTLVSGPAGHGIYLKHVITIAELTVIVVVGFLSIGFERFTFLGWLILAGGLATGLAARSLGSSDVTEQVGLGTIAAARTCLEVFVFALVAMYPSARRAEGGVLAMLVIPDMGACLVGYALLPVTFTTLSDDPTTILHTITLVVGIGVVACTFVVMSSLALKGVEAGATGAAGMADARGTAGAGGTAGATLAGAMASSGLDAGVGARIDAGAVTGNSGARGAGRTSEAGDLGETTGPGRQGEQGKTGVAGETGGGAGASWVRDLAQLYGLTPRECDVAEYVYRGYSAKRTAELMNLTLNTVQSHTRKLYRKLDIHSRQELIDLVDQPEG